MNKPTVIGDFFPKKIFKEIQSFAESLEFVDGGKTANGAAKKIKSNLQADYRTSEEKRTISKIAQAIQGHALVQSYFFPKKLTVPMVSKYMPGMSYGKHVDRSHIGSVRTDYSFTYCLSSSEDYEGGELVVHSSDDQQQKIKLQANSIVIYDTNSVHEVLPVIKGERLCLVGWIECLIPFYEMRECVRQVTKIKNGLKDSKQNEYATLLNNEIQNLIKIFSR